MRKALAVLALSLLACLPSLAQKPDKKFVQQVFDSVVLLYAQDETGGMHMLCTATAFEQVPGGYRFVSAAHCVQGRTDKEQKSNKYYVTTDEADSKTFLNASLVEAGDKLMGDDFSIFEVKTVLEFRTVSLGDSSSLSVGDRVINVASPYGLGKQYFEGYVSMPHLDRPPIDAQEVHWTDVMLIEVGSAGGSSGSAIVSEDQHAIVGFLVGGTSSTIGAICVPVNKFKAFNEAVKAGKYHKTKASETNAGSDQ